MGRRKKEFCISKDDLAYEEEVDEVCFTDYVPLSKDAIATFNFSDDILEYPPSQNKPEDEAPLSSSKINFTKEVLFDNRHKTQPNGLTPPIDGEALEFRRSYSLRGSTIQKLNELKAANPNFNVYMNTVVDYAICHYYDYIIKDNNPQPQ